MKKVLIALWILFFGLWINQACLGQSIGTAFTYQGKLSDGGVAASGAYDLEFRLYDAPSVGNQVGGTLINEDVGVVSGYFTVLLDFGTVFDGRKHWLQIGVRPGESTDKPDVKVSWQVTGIRRDAYARANPIVVEQDKPAEECGLYLHPEAFGLGPEKGVQSLHQINDIQN